MAPSIVTASMTRKAEALAEFGHLWTRGRSKVNSREFYVVPGSTAGTAHWTALDGCGCTCLGNRRRGTCTHAMAAAIVTGQQAATPTVAPRPRVTYDDLFPACGATGCDDEPVKGSAYCHRHDLADAF